MVGVLFRETTFWRDLHFYLYDLEPKKILSGVYVSLKDVWLSRVKQLLTISFRNIEVSQAIFLFVKVSFLC